MGDWSESYYRRRIYSKILTPTVIKNRILKSITYILPVGNQRGCWLVDCGDVEKIIAQGWNIRGVLLTHAHTDHIYGINKLLETFPDALIYTNVEGEKGLQNPKWNFSRYHDDVEDFIISSPQNVRVIEKEGTLQIDGDLPVEVLFTPGHEPSCLSFVIGKNLFTGDAYITDSKTVVTFPRSNKQLAIESENKLKLMEKEGYTILSGHWVE